jgi:hypothetical protein
MVSISGGVGKFVAVVTVVERGDATVAWYWKGLPARTSVFKKQKFAPEHKLSAECFTVMCCGNEFENQRLKIVVTGKVKKLQGY